MSITDVIDRIRAIVTRDDTAAWLDHPAGCCHCGTGGPHDDGRKGPAVTRYLYGAEPYCEAHALPGVPDVDLGADQIITGRDLAAYLPQQYHRVTARPTRNGWAADIHYCCDTLKPQRIVTVEAATRDDALADALDILKPLPVLGHVQRTVGVVP